MPSADALRVLVVAAAASLLLAAPASASLLAVPADPAALGYDALAAQTWGAEPCGGHVDVAWAHMGVGGPNAHAEWIGAPGRPDTNTACSITFNLDAAWDLPKLCTVDAHERGHLLGHEHDDGVLMNAYYVGPAPGCGGVPGQQPSSEPARKGYGAALATVRGRAPSRAHVRRVMARLRAARAT